LLILEKRLKTSIEFAIRGETASTYIRTRHRKICSRQSNFFSSDYYDFSQKVQQTKVFSTV